MSVFHQLFGVSRKKEGIASGISTQKKGRLKVNWRQPFFFIWPQVRVYPGRRWAWELYASSFAQINSAAFLPLISMPPKIGPIRKLPLTPLAAMPDTKRPG